MLKDGSDGEESKTFEINLPNKGNYSKSFNFLGYSFNLKRRETMESKTKKADFKAIIEISNNKIGRYESRLVKAIESYNTNSKFNEKESRKMLFERLKFLTGNFHLNNNKKNIKSGIYYSNEMLRLNTEKYNSLKKFHWKSTILITEHLFSYFICRLKIFIYNCCDLSNED